MANPLETGSVSPPAPNQNDNGNALQQGAPAQQQQQAAPAVSHQELVSGLRHCDAIKSEVEKLLRLPSLGKSSIKSQVISAVTDLVSSRILTAANAVTQLSSFPDAPLDQRKALQQQLMQTVQTERTLIAHHAMSNAGGGPEPTPSADSHLDDIASLHANYSQK